ncbi:response regulator [Balneatrix alpica]|uniref:Response regulator n=1 Tax=Balneatrix alpica TaxID=75684 RepID=A0ABV5ZCP0_9GAMM|nr:response regulator [Balneatrix alpica]
MPSILLVEDNQTNRLLYAKMLKSLGVQVIVAEHGEAALEALRQNRVEMVLMDLEMPVMGGAEAANAMRLSALTRAPIIALTATDSPEVRKLCKAAKMNGFIEKPLKVPQLQQLLSDYLGWRC